MAQKQPDVDFTHVDAEIKLYSDGISGIVKYDFIVNSTIDSISFDAIDMEFAQFYLDKKEVSEFLEYDKKKLTLKLKLIQGNYVVKFGFAAKPRQTLYFLGFDDEINDNQQIWTQGQGKYTSHWLPSFDDMNEKVEFDLTIYSNPNYNVIANGRLTSSKITGGLKTWKFNMKKPMSSYLVAFVIGNFEKKVIKSNSGIPIELYYEPKDSLRVEPTYRYTKQIFDFLEEEIGFPYPWQNYKQVPVQDFMYAGMENTGTTIFSNQYMIDSTAFIDKNYVNVNAHELAHQWFGNLVTEESGEHHWLHEGFATYYAYLAEKHLFGDDHFYWKLYETAKTLHNLSENGDGEALTNPNANSLTFYERGAWALVMLKDEVGEEAFKNGTKAYLEKHQFENVTIANFLSELESSSGQNLSGYRKKWLESEEFPWEEVKTYLMTKSSSIRMFFIEKNRELVSFEFLKTEEPIQYKLNLINEHFDKYLEANYMLLLRNKEPKIRLKALELLDNLSDLLKEDAESLLNDSSYLTRELSLYKLWTSFPDDRIDYLEKTKENIGLPNKNIRLLWLTLALITSEYQSAQKLEYYNELNGYTAPHYHFEVRQIAFRYLSQIQAFSDESLRNLIIATNHHVWQFKKSSRNLLKQLAQNNEMKTRLLNVSYSMAEEEQFKLKKLINP
ncbi:M1 family metallopeptidase [Croceitalea sp. P059]|uniref:M1 family metallopeptidase n=1 Tax=Croceitalea sp. P059 TaxID=3075601 RepID=UPI002884731C|nr:M1 family metallopeptidase [Croceitalea sp. P059]MDT0539859.1 M1 family metallopeptidase [Croceitalea sp. P059]